MEQQTVTSHLLKGLIIAAALMGLDFYVRKTGGTNLPSALRYLPTLLLGAGIAVSCIIFGRQTGGTQPFGNVFAHGFKTTAFVTFLMAVYVFIIVKYVYPPTQAEMEALVKDLQKQGNMMEQEARRTVQQNAGRSWIIEVGGTIFATVITGLAGSLLGAALTRKKP